MAQHWCKVASNLDSHPKIRKAGRLGREVFLFALRRNAEPGNPIPGRIPKDELADWYVADLLQMTRDEAVTGVTAAVTAGLLTLEGDAYQIVAWKGGWGKDNIGGADRTAKWRENKKLETCDKPRDARDVTECHGDTSDTDKTRLDKTIQTPPSQVDLALATILILEVAKNNPRHAVTRLTGAEKDKRLAKWADHVRLMREVDQHTEAEIKAVIRWCQADNFWKSNIQSTEKLREKWDTLVAQMSRGGQRPAPQRQSEQPKLVFTIGGVEVER